MSDLEEVVDPIDRPVWGAAAIGRVIRRSEAEVFYLLGNGLLDANKIGGRWTSTPRRLLNSLTSSSTACTLWGNRDPPCER